MLQVLYMYGFNWFCEIRTGDPYGTGHARQNQAERSHIITVQARASPLIITSHVCISIHLYVYIYIYIYMYIYTYIHICDIYNICDIYIVCPQSLNTRISLEQSTFHVVWIWYTPDGATKPGPLDIPSPSDSRHIFRSPKQSTAIINI